MLSGISKLKVDASAAVPGHPPSIVLMTLKVVSAVGDWVKATDSWQSPPLWTAVPLKLMVCCSPTAMAFVFEIVKPFWDLQGNCEAVMGLLSILSTLYGTGESIMMWAEDKAKRAVAAKRVDLKDMMIMLESYNDKLLKECM
jgi:hypothetical protein